jgi:hypothetical protein
MFALVTVVYCTPTKKSITATVFDTARVSTSGILLGRILILWVMIYPNEMINPMRNLAKDTSIPWMDDVLVIYFANTVDKENVTAERSTYIMPFVLGVIIISNPLLFRYSVI